MANEVYTKEFLSGSTDGEPIAIAAVATPGTLIHTADGAAKDEVWIYIHLLDLPYNALHDQGYPSIGCQPCTQPVAPGQDERAGRWSGSVKTECGIHLQPLAA